MGPESSWSKWAYKDRPSLRWDDTLNGPADQSLCVWYSPWQHQTEENPLIPLLLEIRAQYSAWMKVRAKASELNRRGGLAGLALLERVVDAAASLALKRPARMAEGTSEAVRKAWREAAPADPTMGDGQRFHLLFEDAVDTLLDGLTEPQTPQDPQKPRKPQPAQGRLIVFIDDLDRCEESTVVQLLESVKLYLGSRRCVFILAMDENAVLSALSRHWKRSDEANQEYLEKLFQAVVQVPVPRQSAVRAFIAKQLGEHQFPDSEGGANFIQDLLEPNPRKLKNFTNGVCAAWGLFNAAAPPAEEERNLFARRFLLFHYLRVQHKPVWRLLERQPWALRVLTKVLNYSASQDCPLPENIQPDEQRILEMLLFRSFSHVLKDDAGVTALHRHIPIAEAVELFNQRIDRKRSDECFIRYYKALIPKDMDLPDAFLYLPEPPSV
jgi:hypothetical protein